MFDTEMDAGGPFLTGKIKLKIIKFKIIKFKIIKFKIIYF